MDFKFSIAKCKCIAYHVPVKKRADLVLDDSTVEYVDSYKYLGLDFEKRALNFSMYFEKQLVKVRKRCFAVKNIGAKHDGLRPKTALKLYKSIIRPAMEYGAQVITPTKAAVARLERMQSFFVKTVLGLDRCTATAAVRLIAGLEPIRARFDFLKLSFCRKILCSDKNGALATILRSTSSHRSSFAYGILEICKKYNIAAPSF